MCCNCVGFADQVAALLILQRVGFFVHFVALVCGMPFRHRVAANGRRTCAVVTTMDVSPLLSEVRAKRVLRGASPSSVVQNARFARILDNSQIYATSVVLFVLLASTIQKVQLYRTPISWSNFSKEFRSISSFST